MALLEEEIVIGASSFRIRLKEKDIKVILDILVYLWNNYDEDSRKDHFSASRATKMIFLVDWYYALHNKDNWNQVTAIPWYYNRYGPYVDLIPVVQRKFEVLWGVNKTLFELKEGEEDVSDSLNEDIKEMCNNVIKDTQDLGYFSFIGYVFRTPIVEFYSRGELIKISQFARAGPSQFARDYVRAKYGSS